MALLQLMLYLFVGGICFCIDIGGFILIRHLIVSILIASAISFVAATVANYLLCCAFVFRSGRFSRPEEMFRLFVIAVVGLGLNSAVVWLLAERLEFPPTLAKILRGTGNGKCWGWFGDAAWERGSSKERKSF